MNPERLTDPKELRSLAHRAVTEGVDLKYVDRMRQALYAAADALDEAAATMEAWDRPLQEWKDLADAILAEFGLEWGQMGGDPRGAVLAALADERAKARACVAALDEATAERDRAMDAAEQALAHADTLYLTTRLAQDHAVAAEADTRTLADALTEAEQADHPLNVIRAALNEYAKAKP
jgi:hypothetical protein